jgi:hypothetical protein
MNAYIYQAGLLCEHCGEDVRARIKREGNAPDDPADESTYDSDAFPQGPYDHGGGEADCPQHCDQCHVFLENPLTTDGVEYVRQTIGNVRRSIHILSNAPANDDAERARQRRNVHVLKTGVALTEWAPFYGLEDA